MAAIVADSSPSTPTSTTYTAATDATTAKPSDTLNQLARKWFALRWHLARTVFSRPLPFFTAQFKLKLGDLLITLPLAGGVIAWAAILCQQREVESSGTPAAIAMLVAFALAVRNNSLLLAATGIPFERMLTYHKFFGGVAWIVVGLHGLAYLLEGEDASDRRRSRRLDRHGDGDHDSDDGGGMELSESLTGALTFYFLSALVVFSLEPVRRRFFDLFLRAHWVFFILIVVFGVMHGAGLMLVGFIPWAVDLVFRLGWLVPKYSRPTGVAHSSQVKMTLVAKDLVRVTFPRLRTDTSTAFQYHAGQYVFLCVPSVAVLEWHPFTIASAPHEAMVTIYIKVLGDWTKRLADSVAKTYGEATAVTMLLDGPYGASSIEMGHYSHLVFVSGGVGVTPMLSIANALYYESVVAKTRAKPVLKVRFVWSVRYREIIETLMLNAVGPSSMVETIKTPTTWLPEILLAPTTSNALDRDAFYAEIYLTKGSHDPSHRVDQQLALCMKHGKRPDIAKILREVGEQAQRDKKSRVGVLVCGPQAMISEVVRASLKLSSELKGVTFDVHQETFDF